LGWDGKHVIIEGANDGTKVGDTEILFLDDEEQNLIEVGNRFQATGLVKAQ
jgi:hypothetical protein